MKAIANPFELIVKFQYNGVNVEVDLSAHYGVTSEGVTDRRGVPIELTPTNKTAIKNFVKNVVIPQIKTHEGV